MPCPDAEILQLLPAVQTDSGMFAFCLCGQRGRRQESYLPVPRLYKECEQKLGYKLKTALSTVCKSGRSLFWKVQENNKGILIQLVWKAEPEWPY